MKKETALQQFESYVRNGQYRSLKQIEQMQSEFKLYLKNLLKEEDGRRFELADGRYIAKFIRKEQYKLHTAAIIEELTCYIRVPLLLELDILKFQPDEDAKKIVEPFQKEQEWYVKPTFNKSGKVFTAVQKGYYESYPSLLFEHEYHFYEQREKRLKVLQKDYEAITHNLTKELAGSHKIELCTLSKIAKKPTYDVLSILEHFGEDFVLDHCSVSSVAVKQLVAAQLIQGSVLKENRELIDIRIEFLFMSLQNEKIQMNMLDQQKELFRHKLQGVLT